MSKTHKLRNTTKAHQFDTVKLSHLPKATGVNERKNHK